MNCNIEDLTGIECFIKLTDLNCSNNSLTELPALPDTLTSLRCNSNSNSLTSLPALPAGLTSLGCTFNQLTSMPDLPETLSFLFCSSNQITALPALPAGIKSIYCYENCLTQIDLSGLSSLTEFNGTAQSVSLTLTKNGDVYSAAAAMTDPLFENDAFSYTDGMLISSDPSVSDTQFTSQTGVENWVLSGTIAVTYEDEQTITEPTKPTTVISEE
ncbi:MAG: hypothetical protein LBH71_02235, partial [Oscillospiraceae bacterium]|nr:hypothetical protein [Oscillospiraceae bacterium]